jgi:hypothetical protein
MLELSPRKAQQKSTTKIEKKRRLNALKRIRVQAPEAIKKSNLNNKLKRLK